VTGYALIDWGSIPGKNKDFLYDTASTQTLRYKNECHCLTSRCLHGTVFNYEHGNFTLTLTWQ